MKYPVMWFEVLGKDGEQLQAFYGSVFGWAIDAANPMKYGLVDTQAGRGIPGGVGAAYDGARGGVTFYIETPDVTATLSEVERRGGRTLMPRKAVGDGTVLGMFADPEGHVIGLVEAR